MLKNGQAVVYCDEFAVMHDALITNCWGSKWDPSQPSRQCTPTDPGNMPPSINLVYVGADAQKDQYGQQIVHACSVGHQSVIASPGRWWALK